MALLLLLLLQVINLGTYDAADDAARVWNEAALLLRGEKRGYCLRQPFSLSREEAGCALVTLLVHIQPHITSTT